MLTNITIFLFNPAKSIWQPHKSRTKAKPDKKKPTTEQSS